MKLMLPLLACLSLAAADVAAQGNGNGKGNGPPAHANAGGNGNGNGNGHANRGNGNGNGRNFTPPGQARQQERANAAADAEVLFAGEGIRGVRVIGGDVVVTADEGTATNPFNCPPGLARKDPPCVPPGLARQGVTTQQWLGLNDDEYQAVLDDYFDGIDIPGGDDEGTDIVYLTSEEVAALYGLDPAPEGSRYYLVDGQPVLVDAERADLLDQVLTLGTPIRLDDGLGIVPDLVLTPEDLATIYGLPAPADGNTYTVVNGQLLEVDEDVAGALALLQIIGGV